MSTVEAGVTGDGVPFISGGSGPRHAVVFFGVNALFRRLDKTANPSRYASQVARLLPDHTFTILGYAGTGFEEIVRRMASAVPTAPDVLVGISLGGFVAMRFASQHPDLVRRLVLLASAHRFSPGGSRMIENQFGALERADFPALMRDNALLFRRPWFNWLLRVALWKSRTRLASEFREPAAILHDYRALFGKDFENNAGYARRIWIPTLVVGGTADQLFDRAAFEETSRLIPNSRLRLFERETHMLPVEKSGEVARVILDFETAG